MSTILRTLRNLRQIGLKVGSRVGFGVSQKPYTNLCTLTGIWTPDAGDTKAGTLIATDRYGNKYYENMEELPLRTRWVDYKEKEYDPSQIEPGWHAWLSYLVDVPPTQDKILQLGVRAWELPEHRPNPTLSRAAYKPYSTVRPKYSAWTPVAAPR
ncbi:complex I NDUFA12 subunit family protein [Aspergillus clavatus NRRL 1]|uniref:NADH dehydrogenase [ubiquinone] 1 alpha subcomplex subunit n=1 Tax=Aspergillus clavatus (strain ATCC 1007 / CBS 513.65 / DSM 816 / NCTC 3887 / NRRL 1 / QM 1276 / 107) TaxID=344612 RepID=A1C9Z6_ASPCL|nr:NADH-ubiquinone oxidoreductase subunit B17.2, putative [Aspergillus clavatus NRRL 1]EAW12564.1 NADH-ubiquinone oxidoreductase subunit B17.2, putative [Aspergillus clavatus NRRL 1]